MSGRESFQKFVSFLTSNKKLLTSFLTSGTACWSHYPSTSDVKGASFYQFRVLPAKISLLSSLIYTVSSKLIISASKSFWGLVKSSLLFYEDQVLGFKNMEMNARLAQVGTSRKWVHTTVLITVTITEVDSGNSCHDHAPSSLVTLKWHYRPLYNHSVTLVSFYRGGERNQRGSAICPSKWHPPSPAHPSNGL